MQIPELKKILCVEDEIDIQKIIKLSLEKIGNYTTIICGSGTEALEKINDFKPDLIVLDVMMPDMNGPETLKEIRNRPEFKDIPIIFMTAKAQIQEISCYKELGVIDVIVKPFDPVSLSGSFKKIWSTYHVKQ